MEQQGMEFDYSRPGPIRSKGYISSIAVREGEVWKKRMQISNVARNYRVGLAISFAVPAFAQQKETIDPNILEQLAALGKKNREAWSKNDAAALAETYTEDAILVTTDTRPVYGREAIEKYYSDLFKQVHFSNHFGKWDQYSPHIIGTAGNEIWSNGEKFPSTAKRPVIAHRLVFSMSKEQHDALTDAGINPDQVLHSTMKKVMRRFNERFHPNDSIGYAYGLHHDTANLHVHVAICPRTANGSYVG